MIKSFSFILFVVRWVLFVLLRVCDHLRLSGLVRELPARTPGTVRTQHSPRQTQRRRVLFPHFPCALRRRGVETNVHYTPTIPFLS